MKPNHSLSLHHLATISTGDQAQRAGATELELRKRPAKAGAAPLHVDNLAPQSAHEVPHRASSSVKRAADLQPPVLRVAPNPLCLKLGDNGKKQCVRPSIPELEKHIQALTDANRALRDEHLNHRNAAESLKAQIKNKADAAGKIALDNRRLQGDIDGLRQMLSVSPSDAPQQASSPRVLDDEAFAQMARHFGLVDYELEPEVLEWAERTKPLQPQTYEQTGIIWEDVN